VLAYLKKNKKKNQFLFHGDFNTIILTLYFIESQILCQTKRSQEVFVTKVGGVLLLN